MIDAVLAPIPGADQITEWDIPYATHSGVLKIGEKSLRVYRLNTGQAIIDAEDMEKFFSPEEFHPVEKGAVADGPAAERELYRYDGGCGDADCKLCQRDAQLAMERNRGARHDPR